MFSGLSLHSLGRKVQPASDILVRQLASSQRGAVSMLAFSRLQLVPSGEQNQEENRDFSRQHKHQLEKSTASLLRLLLFLSIQGIFLFICFFSFTLVLNLKFHSKQRSVHLVSSYGLGPGASFSIIAIWGQLCARCFIPKCWRGGGLVGGGGHLIMMAKK